ncbi:hypothetical protein [Absidia glauca]|uniref:Uncharacterized protein n=1 Tax=Absidia glauca TaxID=4829 RepID=A0A168Q4F4_ABSGL|nr:hypothetical protein [Absidia glauca]
MASYTNALERVQQKISEEAALLRPKKTDMAYKSKQLEFLDWCAILPGPETARPHTPSTIRQHLAPLTAASPIWLRERQLFALTSTTTMAALRSLKHPHGNHQSRQYQSPSSSPPSTTRLSNTTSPSKPLSLTPKKNAHGSTSLCTILPNILTKSLNSDV